MKPKKIVISGVRATAGTGGGNRQNVFNKEFLYLNLQSESENGCQVTVFASFKKDGNSISKVLKN